MPFAVGDFIDSDGCDVLQIAVFEADPGIQARG